MGREKKHCSECKYLKFVDSEGYGYCSLLEEADVMVSDEACIEFEKEEVADAE